jgi:transcription factor E
LTKPMSDEEIAKRCGLKVSDVRAVLNRLHEYGVTTYLRERDKDTGWFSYNWTVNVIKLYDLVGQKRESGVHKDEEELTYEKSYTFYTCENSTCSCSGQRVPESEAIITTYACQKCGERLSLFDNSSIIKSIEEKLASRGPADPTFVKELKAAPKMALPKRKLSVMSRRHPAPVRKARRSPKIVKGKAKVHAKASTKVHKRPAMKHSKAKAKKRR